VKINKESLSLLKQIVHISKEDMEDYNLAMFTHAMDLFKERASLKKSIPKHFFISLLNNLSTKIIGNPWQLVINKIHETQKMTLCNTKHASMGATRIK
jgi:hypothetical protein